MKNSIYVLILALLSGCNQNKPVMVTFSDAILATGKGSYSNNLKEGEWTYTVGQEEKSIDWIIYDIDSTAIELNLPSNSRLENKNNSLLYSEDNTSNCRFSITSNDLTLVKSLDQYVSIVNNKLNEKNQNVFVGDFYKYNSDSIFFGFFSQIETNSDFGYFILYRKGNNAIIDYSYRFPLIDNSKWHQAIFWEIIYSINGERDLEFTERKFSTTSLSNHKGEF